MDNNRREIDKPAAQHAPRSTDPQDYQALPQNLAVMPKRFPDGFHIAPHHHERDQLIYAVSGLMRVSTSDDTWVVPPDRALLMPAGVEHSIEIRGDVEMRTLYITPSWPAEIKVLTVLPLLRELVSSLAHEPMNYSGHRRAEQIAALILSELGRAEALPLNIPLPQDSRLQKVCQIQLSDPSSSLSLEQLADQAGASSKTLARLCTRELGMNFGSWRQRVRFAKALELLERNQPIKQIAHSCGYQSPSAFTFAFRKDFAVPPSEFRR